MKIARKHAEHPLLWAKCLLGTCYSIWFLHLPSMVLQGGGSISDIRRGHHLLERMQRLRLHPVEEICYRVTSDSYWSTFTARIIRTLITSAEMSSAVKQ